MKRSATYRHFSSVPANKTIENQKLSQLILEIYHLTKKRFDAGKIKALLSSDYGINISIGRVQRLMNEDIIKKYLVTNDFSLL